VIRVFADVVRGKSDHIGSMLMRASENFRTGDALFAFDEKLRVLSWNKAAEVMTGFRRAKRLAASARRFSAASTKTARSSATRGARTPASPARAGRCARAICA
jgi:PAS domain-containing protein